MKRELASWTFAVPLVSFVVIACSGSSAKKNDPVVLDDLGVVTTPGAPTVNLEEAVKKVDLASAAAIAGMPARLRDLGKSHDQPRAAGVMLRALAVAKKEEAAAVGCDLLDSIPIMPQWQMKEDRALLDASLIAIAHGKGACADKVLKRLGDDHCVPTLRCNKDGSRIPIGAPTDQQEPLCTAEMLAPEVEKELARSKEEILAEHAQILSARWALAALRALAAVPADLEKAHARRQYALTQVAKPECGMGAKVKEQCHCEEAAIRDQACRNVSSPVTFSTCRFDISDEKKTITNVIYP